MHWQPWPRMSTSSLTLRVGHVCVWMGCVQTQWQADVVRSAGHVVKWLLVDKVSACRLSLAKHSVVTAFLWSSIHRLKLLPTPGGMVEFRRSLAASFLFQFFVHLGLRLEADAPGYSAEKLVPPRHASAAIRFERHAAEGLQYYSKAANAAIVGQPQRHVAADLQVRHKLPCGKSCRLWIGLEM